MAGMMLFDEIIEKFNPYHGKDGRFASAPGGGTGGIAPSVSAGSAVGPEKDSSGKKLSAEQMAYFKDSKVLDDKGRLLRVYHGTASEFTEFDRGLLGSGTGMPLFSDGFYFTDKKRSADGFGGRRIDAYLNLTNPYYAKESDAGRLRSEALTKQGYDGVVLKVNPSETYYIAFQSNQIKAIDNRNPTGSNDILKANPYHDPKNGRFTSGPGGGTAVASRWADTLEEEKAKVLAMDDEDRALYVLDHGGESEDNCVAAVENEQTEALVNNYFAIMAANGDPTPTKQTSGQLDRQIKADVEDGGKYEGYEEARTGYIKDMAGMSEAEAAGTYKEFNKWFGNDWESADTATLDKYIEQDHVYDGTMYRGMKFDHEGFDTFMKDIEPGAQIKMKRNASWSSDEDVARRFGAHIYDDVDTVMVTCVKNRTSAPVAHLSTQGEAEILAHSGASWTVLHSEVVTWSNGAKKAYLTVVESGEQ